MPHCLLHLQLKLHFSQCCSKDYFSFQPPLQIFKNIFIWRKRGKLNSVPASSNATLQRTVSQYIVLKKHNNHQVNSNRDKKFYSHTLPFWMGMWIYTKVWILKKPFLYTKPKRLLLFWTVAYKWREEGKDTGVIACYCWREYGRTTVWCCCLTYFHCRRFIF